MIGIEMDFQEYYWLKVLKNNLQPQPPFGDDEQPKSPEPPQRAQGAPHLE